MIHEKAISLLVEECGIPYSSWLFYYPHSGSITGASFCGFDYDVDSPSSSGDFNTPTSSITLTDWPTDVSDFTVISKITHTGERDAVIFNNLSSGSSLISGISFGVTRHGRLFLESYSELGVESYVTDFSIPNTGVISLSKSSNGYSVGLFDSNTQKSKVQDFYFEYTCKTTSFLAPYIGGPRTGITGFVTGGFEGRIDDLSIFSGCLRPEEIDRIALGCVITGTSTTGYSINDILSIRYNAIAVFDEIDNTDTFSYILPTGISYSGANYDASYDSVIGMFSANGIDASGCNLFVNGVIQESGTGIITGSYNPILTSSRDYTPTGDLFAGLIRTSDDRAVFDLAVSPAYIVESFSHSGTGAQVITGANSNAEVFFNGILLSTGDYSISGTSFVFASGNPLYNGTTGVLSVHYFDYVNTTKTQQSGKPTSVTSFNSDSSILYINGVRQNLSEDYEEIGARDPRNKSGIFPVVENVFYNDLTFTL